MPIRGFKLPTKFYAWFRRNIEQVVALTDQQNASAQHIASQLDWKRAVDIKKARELSRKHGEAIHAGDWSGVEKDLFAGLCPYYQTLPSVRRVLHELGDARVPTAPPAPRKRSTKKRARKATAGQGGVTFPTPIAPPEEPPGNPAATTAYAGPKVFSPMAPRTPNAFGKPQHI